MGRISADVQLYDLKIDIEVEGLILIASFRIYIFHLSACGGTRKFLNCRAEIIEILINCHSGNELEHKLSDILPLISNIRLGYQIKLKGNEKYRRLLLGKKDIELNNRVSEQKISSIGTQKNLTILFCDIKGFTLFSEALSVYNVIFIFSGYFSIM